MAREGAKEIMGKEAINKERREAVRVVEGSSGWTISIFQGVEGCETVPAIGRKFDFERKISHSVVDSHR
jgi:hypothetical protein